MMLARIGPALSRFWTTIGWDAAARRVTAKAREANAMFEGDEVRPKAEIKIGEELTSLSIEELEERIETLKGEIVRIGGVLTSKKAGRAAADAVFGGK